MEQSIKPDQKYFTKVLLIQLTISLYLLLAASIVHLIINIVNEGQQAIMIIWLVAFIIILLMWIISTPISKIWIKNLNYMVYEDRIIINKGILTKTQQNIPFRAITDFAFERTLYDRILGIGSIKIQTAGQSTTPSGYEGKISGLIEYEKWYTELREKIKRLHTHLEENQNIMREEKDSTKILEAILQELKEINENTEYKKKQTYKE